MRILITGICGFVGSTLAHTWAERGSGHELYGIDNFVRPGSEINRQRLRRLGVKVRHGDIRSASDFESLPPVDWLIDAAANPSVLAGVDGRTSSRQLIEHNLLGTVNLLEYCRQRRAGFILLSTSRVYSVAELSRLPVEAKGGAFTLSSNKHADGVSNEGVSEAFSTEPPVSLYGATKRASEQLAVEYGDAFDFPVRINRCGVLAGAGQFGRADQGIFSYWIHAWASRRPLAYIGFDGTGHQVRDCLHPRDLAELLDRQMQSTGRDRTRIINLGGGVRSAMSLKELSAWCTDRFGVRDVRQDLSPRAYDVPWLVLDSRRAMTDWQWSPQTGRDRILEEIAVHAEANPSWFDLTYD
jgi:CDP-paratose 2-epimerase